MALKQNNGGHLLAFQVMIKFYLPFPHHIYIYNCVLIPLAGALLNDAKVILWSEKAKCMQAHTYIAIKL